MDIQNGEVIIRIPVSDGSVLELRGRIKSLNMTTRRDVHPIYSLGSADPHSFIAGSTITEFSLEGYADSREVYEPAPDIQNIKPCRWADIIEDIDE